VGGRLRIAIPLPLDLAVTLATRGVLWRQRVVDDSPANPPTDPLWLNRVGAMAGIQWRPGQGAAER
jgi:hypothetical protein